MKKILNKSFVPGLAMLAFGFTGCERIKDFGDTNLTPNGTPVVITKGLFTRAVAELGGKEGGVSIASYTRPGYYAQFFSETQYPEVSLYGVPQLEFSNYYYGFLMDLQNIINQNSNQATAAKVAESGSNANQISTARILKAYAFWTLTDRWGDIPYSEALTGSPIAPKYDTQESIYADLLKELKEAVDGFDNGLGMQGDVIFNGNNDKWKRFANSLRMQIALRMSKVHPTPAGVAATAFKEALNHPAGSIESNSDNAQINYSGGAYQNPWYTSVVVSSRIDDAMSSTMQMQLNDFLDPRIATYGATPIGFPYGISRDKANKVPLGWGLVLAASEREEKDPVVIMNAATVLLARAEAAELGWTSENAADLYKQGVTQALSQWGYGDKAATYLNNAGVAYGAAEHLKKIATQKWLALYPDGLQGWCEWRRTGFPELVPAVDATNSSGEIPRRFVYGTGEYGNNNANVKEAVSRIPGGKDSQDARVWWDKE